MVLLGTEDAIVRENRRSELARRLISHVVRTGLITRLTGLTRGRLATVRRRLMVRTKGRRRGPTKSSLSLFLGSPRARAEGAAMVSFYAIFGIPIERHGVALPKRASLDFSERLCETYEAYCACFPQTEMELEEMILLRRILTQADDIEPGKCRSCKCLILVDRFKGGHKECSQCEAAQSAGQETDYGVVERLRKPKSNGQGQHREERKVRYFKKIKKERGEQAENREASKQE
jgi:hypothetical protein